MKKKTLLFGLFLLAFLSVKAQQKKIEVVPPLCELQLKAELPREVEETSGLFFHNGLLWTHNDSGGKPILYALDTTTFTVVQRVTLRNAKSKDWEDVCTDGINVYVGDFGNNKGRRKNLRIYTFPLASLPAKGDTALIVDSIRFRFADQIKFDNENHNHDFDCEAIFPTEDFLYLFGKGWATGTTRLYRLPKTPGNHVAEVVNSFDSQGLITGVDYDPKNRVLALVGYVKTVWKPFMYLFFDFEESGQELSYQRFEMPFLQGGQIEGICFFDEGRCFVSAETSQSMTARVFVADFRKCIKSMMKK